MKEKYLLIDNMLMTNNDFKMSLFDLEYNEIIGKISRMAYKYFDAKTPSQANKIVDYIPFLNPFEDLYLKDLY